MDRREVLKISIALAIGAAVSVRPRLGVAQSGEVINEMIFERPWQEREVFYNLRLLSASLIGLRIFYSGPIGYESEKKFAGNVWYIWREALGPSADKGHAIAQNKIAPALVNGFASSMAKQMDTLFAANGERFVSWLKGIGIAPGRALQKDLLRAQALFAVAAGVLIGKGDLGLFKDDTWVYPFC